MTFISYAQNFEDVLLWRALGHCSPGRYIDVGAQDPLVDSVSRAFYEAGWEGVHVEPLAEYAAALSEAFPTDTIIEAALSKEVGSLTFYELAGGGLSTACADIAQFHHKQAGLSPVIREVATTTLALIFEKMGDEPIHWLKIDVEGYEREVLEGWGSAPQRPWVVLVESTFPTTANPTHDAWEELVIARNYALVYTDGLNRYYLHDDHRELRDKFRYPPNVLDNFELNGTATSLTTRLVRQHREKASEQLDRIGQLSSLLERVKLERDAQEVALLGLRRQNQLEQKNHSIELERLRSAGKLSEAMERLTQSLEAELHSAQDKANEAQSDAARSAERAEAAFAELSRMARELELANASLDRLHAERDRLQQQADNALADNEDLSQSLQESLANVSQLILRLDLQAANIAELEDRLRRQTGQTVERAYDLHRSRAKTEAARAEVAQLIQELALRVAGIERMDNMVAALRKETEGLAERLDRSVLVGVLRRLGLFRIDTSRATFIGQQASLLLAQLDQEFRQAADSEEEWGRIAMSTMLANGVNELLTVNGVEFVDVAYRTLLKRSPDRAGRDHFLERLRAGDGKEAVIIAMADSPEAKALPDTLEGLASLRAREAGRRGSRFVRGEVLRLERTMNRLEFSLGEMHARTARQSDRILERLDLLENQVAALAASGGTGSVADSPGGKGPIASPNMARTMGSLTSQVTETVPARFIEQLRNAVRQSAEAAIIADNTH